MAHQPTESKRLLSHIIAEWAYALKYEHIRHDFWCKVQLTPRALAFARKHGRSGILREARKRVETKLVQPGRFADWGQTPFENTGNAIHFAQHATATCCRACLATHHGVAPGAPLTGAQIERILECVRLYWERELAEERPCECRRCTQRRPAARTRAAEEPSLFGEAEGKGQRAEGRGQRDKVLVPCALCSLPYL